MTRRELTMIEQAVARLEGKPWNEMKVFKALCAMEAFVVKGIPADEGDFGSGEDEDRESAEAYACGNRVWRGRKATPRVLEKYGITEQEYDEIVAALEGKLSFGRCGWCA